MSEVQSQGSKLAEVSSLLSGSRDVPATVNGQGFGLEPVSSRAPTTRSEDHGIRKVALPSKEDYSAADLSPMVVSLSQMQVPALDQNFFAQGQALENEVTRFWNAASELMEAGAIAEQRGDHGIAANFKLESGQVWAQAQGMRQQWLQMKGHYEQVVQLQQLIEFQKGLLHKHGWLASKREWERCLKWAMREFQCTEQEALWAQPAEIVAGLEQYEKHCKAAGYKLGQRPAVERGNASIISAKAKSLARQGKLSPERQASLVSLLLSGGA